MKRPNILFIMFDQLAPQSMPAYGHKVVKTPHIDSIAENAVVFDNAYCNSPLCAPARFSLMAGRLCSEIGAYDNASEFRADIPTFAHYLRAEGYRTVLSGKMHFIGPDQKHGYEERLTTDIYPADYGWTPDWLNHDKRWFWFHNMQSVVEAGVYERTLELDYDDEVFYTSKRHLYDMSRDTDERPFFMTVSFIQPHDPYMTPQAYWDRYRHDDIDMPKVAAPDEKEDDDHSKRLRYTCQMDQYKVTHEHVRNARHAYYGMISWLDERVGGLLDVLEQTGQQDNTIIVLTSDHGDMLGERGLWYKMSFFERSVRVPLMIYAPQHFKSGRSSANVSHVDLLPTFMELATDGKSFQPNSKIDGRSLLPSLTDHQDNGSDVAMSEYLAEGTFDPLFMLRNGEHKYIYSKQDSPLLFNTTNDPNETSNLSGDPSVADIEKELENVAKERWDPAAIKDAVIDSQQRRLFLQQSMLKGANTVWDYQPVRDASTQYNRNYGNELYESDRRARIPFRDPPPFDGESSK